MKYRKLQYDTLLKKIECHQILMKDFNMENFTSDEEIIDLFKTIWGEKYQCIMILELLTALSDGITKNECPAMDSFFEEKIIHIYELLELTRAERIVNNEN